MQTRESLFERVAFWSAFASVVSVIVSIAVSQILLGLSCAALLLSRTRLRFPPIIAPLLLFMAGTVISLALSGDPWAGRSQIRKFFVYLTLLVVFSTFRSLKDVRLLFLTSFAVGAVDSALAIVQFARKWEQAEHLGANFYQYYIGERITGFMSHWMTFGGQDMMLLLSAFAFLLFSPRLERKVLWLVVACLGFLMLALVLGFTRSVWLGSAMGLLYLVFCWRPRLAWLFPAVLVACFFVAPLSVKERVLSSVRPHGETDSNQHRIICWRTGLRMIEAHPVFGLGPEQVRIQFMNWLPPDVKPPLPRGWYGHLHSIYIHYAAERGIPTLLALLFLLGKVIYDFARALRRLPPGPQEGRFVLHAGIASVIGILISGIFEVNLGDSEVLAMFLAIVAVGYIAVEPSKTWEGGQDAA